MATPKKAETVESKPADANPAKLFEKLGAPLFNSEWSRGALHPNGTVYLMAEKDGVVVKGDEQPSPSQSERLMHLQRVKAGHPCVLVIGGQLFAGGLMTEKDGEVRIDVLEPIKPEPQPEVESPEI